MVGRMGRAGVRFVMRWPKRYQLLDSKGANAGLAIALGKRAWGAPRWIWDGQLRKLRQTSVLAIPVRHAGYGGPLWLVVARRGGEPWYLLTNEPIESEEAAWQVVVAYARRWQVETSFRYGKSELHMESPRLQQWEPRRKLLLLVTLVYALLSLLAHEYDLVRQGLRSLVPSHGLTRTKDAGTALPLALGTQPLVATLSTLLQSGNRHRSWFDDIVSSGAACCCMASSTGGHHPLCPYYMEEVS